MVTILRRIVEYLGLGDPLAEAKRNSRLTEEEALTIARKAAGQLPGNVSIHLATIVEEAGERLWIFATNTRGLTWQIKVRDRDGCVVGQERVGMR